MIDTSQTDVMSNWVTTDGSVLVSIKCITYNQEKYISDALDGFLSQKTDFPFEVVVHDDASTDKTAEIIKEYASKYPRIIKPLYETENQYSKGNGILGRIVDAKLSGKYIAFCEGDDYWIDENKLQKQIDYLESNPDYGLCFTDCNFVDAYGNVTKRDLFKSKQLPVPQCFKEHLFNLGYIAPMSWVMRKSVYDTLDMSYKSTDGTFVRALEFFLKSKVYFMDSTTCCYRQHEGSVSKQTDPKKMYKYQKGVFETGLYYCKKYLDSNSISDYKTVMYRNLCNQALLNEDKDFIYDFVTDSDISNNLVFFINQHKVVYRRRDGSYSEEKLLNFPVSLKTKEDTEIVEIGYPQIPFFIKIKGVKNQLGNNLEYRVNGPSSDKDMYFFTGFSFVSIPVVSGTESVFLEYEIFPISGDFYKGIFVSKMVRMVRKVLSKAKKFFH